MCSRHLGHMTEMATISIYCKKNLKSYFQNLGTDFHETWYVALETWAHQCMFYDDPMLTLTYVTARSNFGFIYIYMAVQMSAHRGGSNEYTVRRFQRVHTTVVESLRRL